MHRYCSLRMHINQVVTPYEKRFPLISPSTKRQVQCIHVLDHASNSHSHMTTAHKRMCSVD